MYNFILKSITKPSYLHKGNFIFRKDNRKTRDLWWKGLPPSVRGRVWKLAVGNDLNITQELFDICTARSKEKIWVSTDVKVSHNSEGILLLFVLNVQEIKYI